MITVAETKERFRQDPRWWKIALMDFVDDFRYHKNPQAVADPFLFDDEQKDAVLASTAETLCDEIGLRIPEWLYEVPACREPYFMSDVEDLMAMSIVQSPARFRLRKIFVLDNFLHRV